MKLLFFGDCMFGRDNRVFFKNPFIHVQSVIKKADVIFFNLETVISPIPIDDKYKWPEKLIIIENMPLTPTNKIKHEELKKHLLPNEA